MRYSVFKNVEDLPLPKIKGYILFDERIESLVKVLNFLGYETSGSCEGHIKDYYTLGGATHPWINILFRPNGSFSEKVKTKKKCQKLSSFVEEYNQNSNIKWILAGEFSFLHLTCWTLYTKEEGAGHVKKLIKLQKSIQDLALFLFENYQ